MSFARHDSGLFVPEEHKRVREVWTREEWQALERATTLLSTKGLMVYIRCPERTCEDAPLERMRNLDGGITLRCNHRDRVVVRFPR